MYSSTQELNEKASKTAEDAKDNIRRVKTNMRDAAGTLGEDLSETARSAGRYVRDLADSAESHLSEATDTVATTVSENPISSIFVALGAGILLGMLIRR